jgi:hypothetical protein
MPVRWDSDKNLQQETQRPKCCLYETPYFAAPVRETGDVIARTLPMRNFLHTHVQEPEFVLVYE